MGLPDGSLQFLRTFLSPLRAPALNHRNADLLIRKLYMPRLIRCSYLEGLCQNSIKRQDHSHRAMPFLTS